MKSKAEMQKRYLMKLKELEVTIEKLHEVVSAPQQTESKTFTMETHLFVYDTIMHHAPMNNFPILLNNITKRSGLKMGNVTHRNTVQMRHKNGGL